MVGNLIKKKCQMPGDSARGRVGGGGAWAPLDLSHALLLLLL